MRPECCTLPQVKFLLIIFRLFIIIYLNKVYSLDNCCTKNVRGVRSAVRRDRVTPPCQELTWCGDKTLATFMFILVLLKVTDTALSMTSNKIIDQCLPIEIFLHNRSQLTKSLYSTKCNNRSENLVLYTLPSNFFATLRTLLQQSCS